jgi:signal transduction histidine kinase
MSEKLISYDKLKDEFLANTSHKLRTPLNGIINITQSVLEGDAGKLTNLQKENLQIVKSAGLRLYNLINDILDISERNQT